MEPGAAEGSHTTPPGRACVMLHIIKAISTSIDVGPRYRRFVRSYFAIAPRPFPQTHDSPKYLRPADIRRQAPDTRRVGGFDVPEEMFWILHARLSLECHSGRERFHAPAHRSEWVRRASALAEPEILVHNLERRAFR